ncbi:hypothetical protein [Xanthomonas sp. MUS 060]|uniref:hypothetical protein n=1 Tax=Xanthomonas sp. MUS 060 TaxID=1588031 RepID=UPI0006968706|nr:hypothetical protein [Xanthomonas sp. MUS 060]
MDKKLLESRLVQWAEEYGGGRYENIGYQTQNVLQSLVEHKGFLPGGSSYRPILINTPGDEVESAVRAMESSGYLRPAHTLRCEYFLKKAPIEVKLSKLRRIGVDIKRPTYYDYLSIAKAFVAGKL